MTVLHLVNRAAALEACLARAKAGDAILLIEDGVYAAMDRDTRQPSIRDSLHVLREHLAVRGLDAERVEAAVALVDFPDFVALTVRYTQSINWS
jgi:tRNA 2-thiouridine synthesizing protein B